MGTICIAKGPMFLQAENQDTDQTEWMCRLTDSFESLLDTHTNLYLTMLDTGSHTFSSSSLSFLMAE